MRIFYFNLYFLYKFLTNTNYPSFCRFYPTCSAYTLDCFLKYNFLFAFLLVVYRILKCVFFLNGGYNPVL